MSEQDDIRRAERLFDALNELCRETGYRLTNEAVAELFAAEFAAIRAEASEQHAALRAECERLRAAIRLFLSGAGPADRGKLFTREDCDQLAAAARKESA